MIGKTISDQRTITVANETAQTRTLIGRTNRTAGRTGKTARIIYWISTVWLALGMLSTGIVQLLKMRSDGALAPPGVYGIQHLGYPVYFLTILGLWKIAGVIALFIPNSQTLKEWAYAGFFFVMSGALFSHIAVGDPAKELFPSLLLLVLIFVSWYLRRRLYARGPSAAG